MAERGGLPWYCLWAEFSRHGKTRELCALVKDRNAGMYVIRLFEHCADQALDGRISASIVEDVADWRGKVGVLLGALEKTGVLEVHGAVRVVHGWEERNGARIRQWLRDNAKRKPKKNPASVPSDSRAELEGEPAEHHPGNPDETPRGFQGQYGYGEEAEALSPAGASTREAEQGRTPPLDGERGSGQEAQPNPAKAQSPDRESTRTPTAVPDDDLPRRPLVVLDEVEAPGLTPRELGTLHRMGMQAPQDRYPGTAAVIAELRSLGWEVAWPRDGSRPAVEAAIVHATVPIAVQRLMAVPLAVRLANPWLGWHLRAIAGEAAGKGGGRGASDVRVGVGVPSPAESFQGGERELTKHS
jgi:hypothetical protein